LCETTTTAILSSNGKKTSWLIDYYNVRKDSLLVEDKDVEEECKGLDWK
jgi:hypothetical protein